MTGGDATALLTFANEMLRRGSSIQSAMNRLGSVVAEANWVGPDRDRFLTEWNSTHRQGLAVLLQGLDDAARRISRHAATQIDASS